MNQQKKLLYFVYFMSFICGMAICFESVFLPEFKDFFQLTYKEQMYTMFTKNVPFLFFSLIIGYYLKKIGYKNCLTISLFLYAFGTILLVPALSKHNYQILLTGFFFIGTGFNFQLVAGNPMMAALGDEETASSRLNIGNALGAVAQIIAPLFIVLIVPVAVVSIEDKLPYIKTIFIGTSILLAVMGAASIFVKDTASSILTRQNSYAEQSVNKNASIWSQPGIILGFVAIFLIVGVEAGFFGFYRNAIEHPQSGGLSAHQSQQMFTVYFALFAAGRLAGSYIQKKVAAATTMKYSLMIAIGLIMVIMFSNGWVNVAAVTAIGFFISIFFPTVYAIAIRGLGEKTGQASGFLNMGFLGCAIIPVVQGALADSYSLHYSYCIAIIPYLFVLWYVSKIKNLSSSQHQINKKQIK